MYELLENKNEYLNCLNEAFNSIGDEIAKCAEFLDKPVLSTNDNSEIRNRFVYLKKIRDDIVKLREQLIYVKMTEKTENLIVKLQNKNDAETIKLAKFHCDEKQRELNDLRSELSTFTGILQNAIFNSSEIMSQASWKIDFNSLCLEDNIHRHTLLSEYLQDNYHCHAEFKNATIMFSDDDIVIRFFTKEEMIKFIKEKNIKCNHKSIDHQIESITNKIKTHTKELEKLNLLKITIEKEINVK